MINKRTAANIKQKWGGKKNRKKPAKKPASKEATKLIERKLVKLRFTLPTTQQGQKMDKKHKNENK